VLRGIPEARAAASIRVPARHARKGRNKRDTERKGNVSDSEIGGDNHCVLAMNVKTLLEERS
jgi:hypothetical protein